VARDLNQISLSGKLGFQALCLVRVTRMGRD
jgi:hypothetical protein